MRAHEDRNLDDQAALPSSAGPTDAYFRAAAAMLATRPDRAEPDVSAALLKRHYGLTGTVTTLSSEVERTADVLLPDGRRLILKTSTRPESSDSFAFQAAAQSGLQGANGFVVPHVLRTQSGNLTFHADGVHGYLQTRIDGVPLHQLPPSSDLLRSAGQSLALLDRALKPAEPPAAQRPVLWHIGCWPHLMSFAPYLPPGKIADQAYFYLTNDSPHEVVAFTVDREYLREGMKMGLPVVAFEEVQDVYSPNDYGMFVAVGYQDLNRFRAKKYEEARTKGYTLISYVSSRAANFGDIEVGDNCFVL